MGSDEFDSGFLQKRLAKLREQRDEGVLNPEQYRKACMAAVSASPALGDEEDAPTPGVSAVSDLLKPSTLLNLDAPIPTTTQPSKLANFQAGLSHRSGSGSGGPSTSVDPPAFAAAPNATLSEPPLTKPRPVPAEPALPPPPYKYPGDGHAASSFIASDRAEKGLFSAHGGAGKGGKDTMGGTVTVAGGLSRARIAMIVAFVVLVGVLVAITVIENGKMQNADDLA